MPSAKEVHVQILGTYYCYFTQQTIYRLVLNLEMRLSQIALVGPKCHHKCPYRKPADFGEKAV